MNNNQFKNIHLLLISSIAFISTNPLIVWGNIKLSFALMTALLVLSFVGVTKKLKLSILLFGGFVLILVGVYLFLVGTSFFWGLLLSFYILVLLFLSSDEKTKTFTYFRNFFAISLIPGLILWFIHHLSGDTSLFSLGLVPDVIIPNQMKVEVGEEYALYPFSVVLLDPIINRINLPVYRFCGMYDEPGAVGTFTALFLVADKVQLKRKINIVLLVSGILSFSLAFFVIILLYYLFMIRHNFIKIALLALTLLFLFVFFVPEDSFIHTLLLDRMSISSEEGWRGDNRDSLNIKAGFDEWLRAEPTQVFFGTKNLTMDGGISWKVIFINAGLVGGLLILCILFVPVLPSIHLMNSACFIFVMLFVASIYQRPDIINPSMILLFHAGFYRLLDAGYDYNLSDKMIVVPKTT